MYIFTLFKKSINYKCLMNDKNLMTYEKLIEIPKLNLFKELINKTFNIKNIYNKNIIDNYLKKNHNEKNRNLHRWCLSNKNKTKRELNYPW